MWEEMCGPWKESGMANVNSTVSIMAVGVGEMTPCNACWASMWIWAWIFSTM